MGETLLQAATCAVGFWIGYYVIGELLLGRIIRGFAAWWFDL